MNTTLNFYSSFMVFMLRLASTTSFEFNEYYPDERDALIQLSESLNSTLNFHLNWTGPPCYNDQSNWAGIACSNWHVVHIVLDGIQLTGSLPPTFLQNITFLSKLSMRDNSLFGPFPNLTNLVNLQFIFLSNNRFSGSIPLELTHLPRLSKLELQENTFTGQIPPFNQPSLNIFNVSDNLLQGPIPETQILQRFSQSSYDHNSELCGKPLEKPCPVIPAAPLTPLTPHPSFLNPSKSKNNKTLGAWKVSLIAVAVSFLLSSAMLVLLCYYRRKNGKIKAGECSGEGSVEWLEKKMLRAVELEFIDKGRPVFDLDDLLMASAELMGKGKVGSTYKATLESGSVVAVKRLKEMNGLRKKEFVQQLMLLGKMRHENLVEIISFYYTKEEKLIVYEYVPHGSLFEHLHDNRGVGRVPLTWTTRLEIVKGIAKGLTFLHESLPSHKVPHANLKSSNILIYHNDHNYHPKLTDFGFLPILPSHKSSEMLAVGRSPEFSLGKKLTHKADVYCFGIVLLEIITGRIPGEFSPGHNDRMDDLAEWVRAVVNDDWSTDILDIEILAMKEGHGEMLRLTEIALECTATVPEKRPNMSEMLRKIEEISQENNKGRE